ncbi:uncharacterized protein EV422DRAFT_6711 [Fimicolochytrium jonesii]|uniref:uncharacterized protein n=1 Tax=Fimicolochytrium jonesii TaxID=1396493 RepID=UPI0022FDE237|nr:uncharacterized protein EV422DRAFT_6711 [Fimicolochytrium jonesii]KAI8826689.1 hypothetical protein EV422DRAFT_6711 [Fimicolochytrium jonesii]
MTSADILVQTAGYGYHPHADEDDYDEQEDEQEDDEHDDIEAEFDELLEAQVRNDIIQEDEEEDDDDDEEEEYRVGRHHDHGQPATFVPQFRPGMPLPMTASVDSEIFHVKSKIAHIMGLLNQEGNLTGEEAAAVERLREVRKEGRNQVWPGFFSVSPLTWCLFNSLQKAQRRISSHYRLLSHYWIRKRVSHQRSASRPILNRTPFRC